VNSRPYLALLPVPLSSEPWKCSWLTLHSICDVDEGRVYSKAVLETLGVDAVRSPEEVMKRYQDGTAQAEGVVEWAEVEGMCIV